MFGTIICESIEQNNLGRDSSRIVVLKRLGMDSRII
jgi:hypothetical protein